MFLVILSFVFANAETIHFGNNWYPKSAMEMLCDFVSLMLFFAGSTIVYLCKP